MLRLGDEWVYRCDSLGWKGRGIKLVPVGVVVDDVERVEGEVSIAAKDLRRSARSLEDPALGIAECVRFNPGFPDPIFPASASPLVLPPDPPGPSVAASSGKCQDASTATSDT
jgi:hypothetical protein